MQLLAAEAAAVQLQESCIQVDNLRAKQTSLADSITLMQSLLEVCACCICAHNCAAPSSSLSNSLVCSFFIWDLTYLHTLAYICLCSCGYMCVKCAFEVFPDIKRRRGQLEEGMHEKEKFISMGARSGPECYCVLI